MRIVLDTSVVVSAIVFKKGRLTWLRDAWQNGTVTPLIDKEYADELLRVLAYPKFQLSQDEIEILLSSYLPYAEPVEIPTPLTLTPFPSAATRMTKSS